jgi:hypothetical protein
VCCVYSSSSTHRGYNDHNRICWSHETKYDVLIHWIVCTKNNYNPIISAVHSGLHSDYVDRTFNLKKGILIEIGREQEKSEYIMDLLICRVLVLMHYL